MLLGYLLRIEELDTQIMKVVKRIYSSSNSQDPEFSYKNEVKEGLIYILSRSSLRIQVQNLYTRVLSYNIGRRIPL